MLILQNNKLSLVFSSNYDRGDFVCVTIEIPIFYMVYIHLEPNVFPYTIVIYTSITTITTWYYISKVLCGAYT